MNIINTNQRGHNNNNWKDGITKQRGYIMVRVGTRNYRPLHRIIMESHLGRKLASNEHVHHINGDITDNSIGNLEVLTNVEHSRRHRKQDGIKPVGPNLTRKLLRLLAEPLRKENNEKSVGVF